jgi:hypothetical protein
VLLVSGGAEVTRPPPLMHRSPAPNIKLPGHSIFKPASALSFFIVRCRVELGLVCANAPQRYRPLARLVQQ